jgi:WD40 repeat protein
MTARTKVSQFRFLLYACVVVFVMCAGCGKHPVRDELARGQANTGLTLATFEGSLQTLSFRDHSFVQGKRLLGGLPKLGAVSPDGQEIAAQLYNFEQRRKPSLGIFGIDGANLREYSDIGVPIEVCWSYNKSELIVNVQDLGESPDPILKILDVSSNSTQEIDVRANVTSQCWSPDGKQIVYEADDTVRVYELGQPKSSVRVLAKGRKPTWSPDGNWIAFFDDDAYYAIRPSGEDRKVLFRLKHPVSAVFWSPDSRFVVYVAEMGLLDGVVIVDAEVYELRVRRLNDNSDDWVSRGVAGGANYQWVSR